MAGERDFEEKAEELRVRREESGEEKIRIAPEYGERRRTVYRRGDVEEQKLLREFDNFRRDVGLLRREFERFRSVLSDVTKGLVEFGKKFEGVGSVSEQLRKFNRELGETRRPVLRERDIASKVGRVVGREVSKRDERLLRMQARMGRDVRESMLVARDMPRRVEERVSFLGEMLSDVKEAIVGGLWDVVRASVGPLGQFLPTSIQFSIRRWKAQLERHRMMRDVFGDEEEVVSVRRRGRLVGVLEKIFPRRVVLPESFAFARVRGEGRRVLGKEDDVGRRVEVVGREVAEERGLLEGLGLRRRGGRVFLEDVLLEQRRGAVIETEKLYVQAGEVIGDRGLLDLFGLGGIGGGVFGKIGRGVGKVFRFLGRRLGWVGLALGGLFAFREGFREQGWLGGLLRGGAFLGGGAGGAVLGSVLGSMVLPGIGTVLGSVVGGVLGALGSEKLMEWVLDVAKSVSVEDIKGALGRVRDVFVSAVTKVLDAIKGGVGVIAGVLSRVRDVFGDVVSRLSGLVEGLKRWWDEMVKYIEEILGRIGRGVSGVVDVVSKTVKGVVNVGKEYVGKIFEWVKEGVGVIARQFETGKAYAAEAAKTVAKTREYIGMWQFTEESAKQFLKEYGYEEYFRGLKWMSDEWVKRWQELSRDQKFVQAQLQYGIKRYLIPGINVMKEFGVESVEKSRALQEMVFARTAQHGVRGFEVLVQRAFRGLTQEEIRRMKPEEVINRVYDELVRNVDVYFRRWLARHPEGRVGLVRRFQEERQALLEMLRLEREGKIVETGIAREMGNAVAVLSDTTTKIDIAKREVGVPRAAVEEGVGKGAVVVGSGGDVDRVPLLIDDLGVLLVLLGVM